MKCTLYSYILLRLSQRWHNYSIECCHHLISQEKFLMKPSTVAKQNIANNTSLVMQFRHYYFFCFSFFSCNFLVLFGVIFKIINTHIHMQTFTCNIFSKKVFHLSYLPQFRCIGNYTPLLVLIRTRWSGMQEKEKVSNFTSLGYAI